MLDVLAMVTEFRQQDPNTPVVLMGYANPVEVMGYEAFAQAATAAGVDGVLTVDMPPEEAGDMNAVFREHQLDSIFLIAPTTTEARTKAICAMATGYIYYVSLKGVTGAGHIDTDEVKSKVNGIKQFTSLPVCVGFGIKDSDSAAAIGECADGVVVGSVLVNGMGDCVGLATRDDNASDDAKADALAGKDKVALAEVVNARVLSIVSEIAAGANR
jgi:tryptophan synthase alpha chain